MLEHPENIYAKNVEGAEVFINDSESGRKGYFCIGCKQEMQAVRFKIQHFKSYFRHDYESSPHERKCVYSSETYRHKLAKEELFMSKQLKVPQLLKYHPNDPTALAIKLKDEKFISAHSVHIEMPFYENGDGEIRWGRSAGYRDEDLLIQPDVAFFDAEGNPFLLIEIVATHKISDEKKAKIRRLGINTVQITVPKDSPEAIAGSLRSSQRTKWIFHNEEAQSDYLQLSKSNPATISFIDTEQRKLLGETLLCREAEIRRLIFSIENCLRTEQYQRTREHLNSENAKVEKFTEQQERELEDLADEYRKICKSEHSDKATEISNYAATQEQEVKIIDERYRNLEKRYTSKAEEVGLATREMEQQIRSFTAGGGDGTGTIENRRKEIRHLTREEELDIRGLESDIERIRDLIEHLPAKFEREEEQSIGTLERAITGRRTNIDNLTERRSSLKNFYIREEKDLAAEIERNQERIKAEEREYEEELGNELEKRRTEIEPTFPKTVVVDNPELPQNIRRIFFEFNGLRFIAEKEPFIESIKRARGSIDNGTFEKVLAEYNRRIS